MGSGSRSDEVGRRARMLVEREVSRNLVDERRIEMALKIARFPMVRELADFDVRVQPSVPVRRPPGIVP